MEKKVKVENTIEVCPPTPSQATCSVSLSSKIKDEWFCDDLTVRVKHEYSSLPSGSDDVYMKLEPLKSEELQIKDEIEPSSTDGAPEKATQCEYGYCNLCNSKFTHKSYLGTHMKIHTGEKPYKCSVCDYSCIRKMDLSRHIKTHTGDKPFKCNICGHRTIRKSDLSQHIKTHTGDKPFKCNVCDYRTIRKSSLSKHVKIHMGD